MGTRAFNFRVSPNLSARRRAAGIGSSRNRRAGARVKERPRRSTRRVGFGAGQIFRALRAGVIR